MVKSFILKFFAYVSSKQAVKHVSWKLFSVYVLKIYFHFILGDEVFGK